MTPDELKSRIEKRRAEISRLDELYYRKAAPEVSDFAYDRLKRELADWEAPAKAAKTAEAAESGLLPLASDVDDADDGAGDSPTSRVGDDRTEGF
jgi:DNA ligase (NAD+)